MLHMAKITDLTGLISLGSSSSSLASKTTSSPCSNETDLLARGSITADSGGVTNVLVVTSSVGMLHRVHGHTTDLRPAVPLHAVLVVRVTSLQHGLLSPASTSNLTDHGTAAAGDNLLGTRGELDPARTKHDESLHPGRLNDYVCIKQEHTRYMNGHNTDK